MAGSDIAAKVRGGLAKAIAATSDGVSLVELRQVTIVSDPINGDTETETWVTLVDAIFKKYDKKFIDGDMIRASDRELVANSSIEINQGDVIRAYGSRYFIEDVDKVSPAEVVLVYKAQCREA